MLSGIRNKFITVDLKFILGMSIVPYNLIIFPTPIISNLYFLFKNFEFPNFHPLYPVLDLILLLPLPFSPRYILPNSIDISFSSSQLDIPPPRNFIHPWMHHWENNLKFNLKIFFYQNVDATFYYTKILSRNDSNIFFVYMIVVVRIE